MKVVILEQDPYHGLNQAHGLCFSVQIPVPPLPSLENIYKELSTDIDDFVHPGHGDLSGWAKQCVLLLNTVLAVWAHQANSHKEKGWEQFTHVVVSRLNQNSHGLVFLLWGSYAQKRSATMCCRLLIPPICLCTEGSLDINISLKPMNCYRSLARIPLTRRIFDPDLGQGVLQVVF